MTKQCKACGTAFQPHAKVPNQTYCSTPECQRERRRRWLEEKRQVDADYQGYEPQKIEQWRNEHPDYWKQYRQANPDYADRNRNLQQTRNQRSRNPVIANVEPDLPPLAPLTATGWQRQRAAAWTDPLPTRAEVDGNAPGDSDDVSDDGSYRALRQQWHPLWGDRRQELAIIGIGLDQDATIARLDACLLDEAEMALGPQAWMGFDDPFQSWSRAMQA